MKKEKELIEKINKETCFDNLKKASTLTGKETESELKEIYAKCLDIQGINLIKTF